MPEKVATVIGNRWNPTALFVVKVVTLSLANYFIDEEKIEKDIVFIGEVYVVIDAFIEVFDRVDKDIDKLSDGIHFYAGSLDNVEAQAKKLQQQTDPALNTNKAWLFVYHAKQLELAIKTTMAQIDPAGNSFLLEGAPQKTL
jgi:hypothetical protein